MESITRKSLLYKSGLGFYCINHVQGCSHGCRYPCYAYMMAQSYGKTLSFTEWCKPKMVSNATELLQKELSRIKTKPAFIHLCLSTDPFMTGYNEVISKSLELIAIMNSFQIPCSVLTKGELPAKLGNRQKYLTDNVYGISLVSIDEKFRNRWEPGTTPYVDRINALHYLHQQGFITKVHMEPYPTPNLHNQNLEPILEMVSFADRIFFGGWNYNKLAKEYDGYQNYYNILKEKTRQFCNVHKIDFE